VRSLHTTLEKQGEEEMTTGVETFSLKGRTIETIIAQQVELSAIAGLEKPYIEKKGNIS
jgi:hypothetical protein